jgi:eukaryotic-like serine/threonine-protein kinase
MTTRDGEAAVWPCEDVSSTTEAFSLAPTRPSVTPEPARGVMPSHVESLRAAPVAPTPLPRSSLRWFRPGDRIRHYELIRELGRGGMGTVFLARDTKLGRKVALKFLNQEPIDDPRRFVVEARATATCSHENIVVLYEADELDGHPYMVLEHLQGVTLAKLLGGRRLFPGRAVELIVPVVRALTCAHAQGIVHRDLKPDNVFVTDAGTVKVLDFGIAKVTRREERALERAGRPQGVRAPEPPAADVPVLDALEARHEEIDPFDAGAPALTQHGAILGSLAFMSPEQWGLANGIDHRSDIWAVGVTLFLMLAGRHPLNDLMKLAGVIPRLDVPMPSLESAAPEVPRALCAVVNRCLRKNREERFPDALALLRALEPFLPGRAARDLAVDESPYAGLAAFQESDAGRFFGRSAEIASFVSRARSLPVCAVVGPSGAGKSSFVRAGVIPALKASGEPWEVVVLRPGRNPIGAIVSALSPMLSTALSAVGDVEQERALFARLREEPGYAGAILRHRARRAGRNVLVFVDQLEELCTMVPDAAERRAFTACLSGMADDAASPTRVVVSLRSDFLDRVAEDGAFVAEIAKGLFFLGPPSVGGMRDALVQPAAMAGYRFENEDVVSDMIDHLRATPGGLPLLQFAALKLWETRDPARHLLTEASYRALGGIAGALAVHADSVLGELGPRGLTLARAVFTRLVTSERTRAIVSLDELRELAHDATDGAGLIDHLVQARLLVVQTGGGVTTVEIVHESLVGAWPTLRRWLDETGEDAAQLEQLRAAAKQWNARGRSADLLWRGDAVKDARRFRRRFQGELPELVAAYLDAVFTDATRAARRARALRWGAVAFLSLLVAASAVALVVIRRAQTEAFRQADAAHRAEGVARSAGAAAEARLHDVERKERERAQAAHRAEEASQELQEKNREVLAALEKAQSARRRARASQRGAEKSAVQARDAREEALRAAEDLEILLKRERDRVERLEALVGSPIETLE